MVYTFVLVISIILLVINLCVQFRVSKQMKEVKEKLNNYRSSFLFLYAPKDEIEKYSEKYTIVQIREEYSVGDHYIQIRAKLLK